jgi:hypothetical protein
MNNVMDYKQWGFSLLAVYGTLFVSGVIISLLSSQLQCSKINWSVSAQQGAIWASVPTVFYGVTTYFEVVRNWFAVPLQSFGIPQDKAPMLGVGYVVMLFTWMMTVWNIHNTEKVACTPDIGEMTAFKKKLMAELEAKQQVEEKNASVKINGANPSQK